MGSCKLTGGFSSGFCPCPDSASISYMRGFEKWRPTRYLCTLCDYVYDENSGELPRDIKPGTKFEDIPDDYVCPVCATDPDMRLRSGNVFRNGFERLNR